MYRTPASRPDYPEGTYAEMRDFYRQERRERLEREAREQQDALVELAKDLRRQKEKLERMDRLAHMFPPKPNSLIITTIEVLGFVVLFLIVSVIQFWLGSR